MNAKKCKTLRQQLRANNVDPRQAEYRAVKRGGAVQIVLGHCGRDTYRHAKAAAKQVL